MTWGRQNTREEAGPCLDLTLYSLCTSVPVHMTRGRTQRRGAGGISYLILAVCL